MKKRSFLDEALHQATLKEQERIIKLLEQSNRCANEFGHEYVPDCYCEAIELIKGSNDA
jgi:hypothetical protein